jgi:hypothetical protein
MSAIESKNFSFSFGLWTICVLIFKRNRGKPTVEAPEEDFVSAPSPIDTSRTFGVAHTRPSQDFVRKLRANNPPQLIHDNPAQKTSVTSDISPWQEPSNWTKPLFPLGDPLAIEDNYPRPV